MAEVLLVVAYFFWKAPVEEVDAAMYVSFLSLHLAMEW